MRVAGPPVDVFKGVGVRVGVLVTPVGVFVGVFVRDGVAVGVLVTPPPLKLTLTGTQSKKKSREVLLETLTIHTRNLALVTSLLLHACPQVSTVLPKTSVRSVDARFGPVFIAVHEEPLFQESSMQKRGEPEVLSARASARTSIPVIVEPEGIDSG